MEGRVIAIRLYEPCLEVIQDDGGWHVAKVYLGLLNGRDFQANGSTGSTQVKFPLEIAFNTAVAYNQSIIFLKQSPDLFGCHILLVEPMVDLVPIGINRIYGWRFIQ